MLKLPEREADHSFHLMSSLRICEALPPIPHTSLWRAMQLNTGITSALIFTGYQTVT
jgi:hypothetical protein